MEESSEWRRDMDFYAENRPDVMEYLRGMMIRLNQSSESVNNALSEVQNVVRHGLTEVRQEARCYTDDVSCRDVIPTMCVRCFAPQSCSLTALRREMRTQLTAINEFRGRQGSRSDYAEGDDKNEPITGGRDLSVGASARHGVEGAQIQAETMLPASCLLTYHHTSPCSPRHRIPLSSHRATWDQGGSCQNSRGKWLGRHTWPNLNSWLMRKAGMIRKGPCDS